MAFIPNVIPCCCRRSLEREERITPLVESGHRRGSLLVESSHRREVGDGERGTGATRLSTISSMSSYRCASPFVGIHQYCQPKTTRPVAHDIQAYISQDTGMTPQLHWFHASALIFYKLSSSYSSCFSTEATDRARSRLPFRSGEDQA
jgi:hypothetical protein